MKRFLTRVLALMMVAVCAIGVAETTLTKDVTEATTIVKMNIDRSLDNYEVVIPAAVTIDPATKSGAATVTLKAGCYLVSCNELEVQLKDSLNKKNSSQSGIYILRMLNEKGTAVNYGINKSVNAGYSFPITLITEERADIPTATTQDVDYQLNFTVDTLPTVGTYTDTLTFGIVLK